MLKIKTPFFAQDENGNEVLVAKGDLISEISDAGPILSEDSKNKALYDPNRGFWYGLDGWNVSFRVTPTHRLWTEIVTVDAVKLLKSLVGE